MLVEVGQFRPDSQDAFHLFHEDAIELVDVLFNVALRLLHSLQDAHVLLDDVHDVVYMLAVI